MLPPWLINILISLVKIEDALQIHFLNLKVNPYKGVFIFFVLRFRFALFQQSSTKA